MDERRGHSKLTGRLVGDARQVPGQVLQRRDATTEGDGRLRQVTDGDGANLVLAVPRQAPERVARGTVDGDCRGGRGQRPVPRLVRGQRSGLVPELEVNETGRPIVLRREVQA